MDLVGTCPKTFWKEWLEEGDCAGEPSTGFSYCWNTRDRKARLVRPGDRFYVVAHDRLRGYAPVVRVEFDPTDGWYCIVRAGGAIPVTLMDPIPGFRGLRKRWWNREDEHPFPDWRIP